MAVLGVVAGKLKARSQQTVIGKLATNHKCEGNLRQHLPFTLELLGLFHRFLMRTAGIQIQQHGDNNTKRH